MSEEATGPEFQAQCWFMVCKDCGECVESMDVHCGGKMRGQFPVGGYAVVSRGYAGYVADCRLAVVEDVDVMDTHRWLGGRLIQ